MKSTRAWISLGFTNPISIQSETQSDLNKGEAFVTPKEETPSTPTLQETESRAVN